MATTIQWDAAAISSNILGTDFDSIADGTQVVLASVLDNSAGAYMGVDFELLTGTFGSATSAGGSVTVELVASLDGTNYADTQARSGFDRRTREVTASTTAKRVNFHFDGLKPYKYKILITNNTGQTTPASGNTFRYVLSREQAVTA